MCVLAMKRHGDDNKDKQPNKRPRQNQVTSHLPSYHVSKCNHTNQQAAQAQPGLVTWTSDLARLLMSFLPGRAIPSLLGGSHTARRLCAYLYELDLSSCKEGDNGVRTLSSLRSLQQLDLSSCGISDDGVRALSSLTTLQQVFESLRSDQ